MFSNEFLYSDRFEQADSRQKMETRMSNVCMFLIPICSSAELFGVRTFEFFTSAFSKPPAKSAFLVSASIFSNCSTVGTKPSDLKSTC